MSNEIRFFQSQSELPNVQNGNIYFILKENNIASLVVDLNDDRYIVNPSIDEATSESNGLLSAEDKKKLMPFIIEQLSNSDVNIDTTNGNFHFLKDIKIKNNGRVLTETSFQSIELVTDDVVENRIEVIPTIDNNFKLKLYLKIPQGPQGLPGGQGPKGDTGPRGKGNRIRNINVTTDNNVGTPHVDITSHSLDEDNDYIYTDLDFAFSNLKGKQGIQGVRGPQGEMVNIEFDFQTGEQVGCVPQTIENYDGAGNDKIIYHVTIPRGEKGEPGKSFKISRKFTSEAAMNAALLEPINDNVNPPTGIPLDSFVLLILDNTDPANGYLYYRNTAAPTEQGALSYIIDLIPVQPEFTVTREISSLSWDENGTSTLTYPTVGGTKDLSRPNLSFSIPRGRPLDFGTPSAIIDKNYGTPHVSITANNVTGDDLDASDPDYQNADYRRQDLVFNFENMGITIDSAEGTVLNTVSDNPTVTVTPSVYDNNTKQKLTFTFEGIKGEKGDQGDMPVIVPSINLSITAGDPSENPAGTASWSTDPSTGEKTLNLSLTNVKGQDGNIASMSSSGSGNGVSNITYLNRELTVFKSQFATEQYAANADNLTSGTVSVSRGGTGLNTVTQNSVLVGDGTSTLKTISSSEGALYSTGNNIEPQFGILPVTLGGTGATSFTQNGVLIGKGTNKIDAVTAFSGALYSTDPALPPQFGTLPVAQGGTGSTFFTLNSLIVGNGTNLKTIASAKGTLISTGANQEPSFGTLGVSDGGTGLTSITQNSVVIGKDSSTLDSVQSTTGAFYSTGVEAKPQFGTLPVSLGGTNATNASDARINLGATHTTLKSNSTKTLLIGGSNNTITTETKSNYKISLENVVIPT